MRQRLFILVGLLILIALLIGLNAASYTQREKLPDSEYLPNRSSFNSGATGTKAYFDLLNEIGLRPIRWTEPPSELIGKDSPDVLVVIGTVRQEFTDAEIEDLMRWVALGNRLVLIDREPNPEMIKTTANYSLAMRAVENPFIGTDAYDQSQMTIGTGSAKPKIPSVLTQSVNSVQPSRYAATITFERQAGPVVSQTRRVPVMPGTTAVPDEDPDGEDADRPTPEPDGIETAGSANPTPRLGVATSTDGDDDALDPSIRSTSQTAPVVHFANEKKNVVVEAPFGSGRIVFVSDPYIVSNAGISIADNSQLALNLVNLDGTIAFDEYHQGFGSNRNRFFEFFSGTPVIAMFAQIGLLVAVVFFSQSRRFARPVPEPEPDRLSKLEYVSAMAQLQQRTHGYDLAIENIYVDFRRRVSRLLGTDNFSTRNPELARLIVERLPDENADDIAAVMDRCAEIGFGVRTSRKEVVLLASRLRDLENKLGLQRRSRTSDRYRRG